MIQGEKPTCSKCGDDLTMCVDRMTVHRRGVLIGRWCGKPECFEAGFKAAMDDGEERK